MKITKITVACLALLILHGCNSSKRLAAKEEPVVMQEGNEEHSLVTDFEKNVGNTIFFEFDQANLSYNSREQLYKQAAWLKAYPSAKATIEGHCDQRGTREYNLALGERRAEAVKTFLLNQGIDASRLDTISYGKEKPAIDGDNEMAWKENRRSVICIK